MLILNAIACFFAYSVGWIPLMIATVIAILDLSACMNVTNKWVIIGYIVSTVLGAIYLLIYAFSVGFLGFLMSIVIAVLWGRFAYICFLNMSPDQPVQSIFDID